MNYLVLLVSQEPQEKVGSRRKGHVGGHRMNEWIVLEKKLKELEKSYDPVFRDQRGNVAWEG